MSASNTLSGPVINLLKGMGWKYIETPGTWEWRKFNSVKGIQVYEGRVGEKCWIADVKAAELLAAEDDPEVWVPTMEFRQQIRILYPYPALQQKWIHISGGGSSEWRDVVYVDEQGEPFV